MNTFRENRTTPTGSSFVKWLVGGLAVLATIFTLVSLGRIVENVDSDEIVVIQDAVDGELHFYTSAGVQPQWFGTVTSYPKRSIYEFEAPVQFNDGGKGKVHGSIQYDMPLDKENLTELHTRYGSPEAIQSQIMEVITDKVIYMTGPTMSSRESYAEKRNYLINYVQDQIDYGIYQTRQGQKEEVDPVSQQKRIVTVAEIVHDNNGQPARQEKSVVGEFGIRAFNFAISQIDYDETVEKQIQAQQTIAMDVQTSVAEALKAQQRTITVEQQGRASAAQAKWEQEVIKAKQVTEAEAALAVATLANQTAEQYRQEQLKRAEADSTYRRKVMEADGALERKLQTEVQKTQLLAEAISSLKGTPLVPSVIIGGANGTNSSSAIDTLLQLMQLDRLERITK